MARKHKTAATRSPNTSSSSSTFVARSDFTSNALRTEEDVEKIMRALESYSLNQQFNSSPTRLLSFNGTREKYHSVDADDWARQYFSRNLSLADLGLSDSGEGTNNSSSSSDLTIAQNTTYHNRMEENVREGQERREKANLSGIEYITGHGRVGGGETSGGGASIEDLQDEELIGPGEQVSKTRGEMTLTEDQGNRKRKKNKKVKQKKMKGDGQCIDENQDLIKGDAQHGGGEGDQDTLEAEVEVSTSSVKSEAGSNSTSSDTITSTSSEIGSIEDLPPIISPSLTAQLDTDLEDDVNDHTLTFASLLLKVDREYHTHTGHITHSSPKDTTSAEMENNDIDSGHSSVPMDDDDIEPSEQDPNSTEDRQTHQRHRVNQMKELTPPPEGYAEHDAGSCTSSQERYIDLATNLVIRLTPPESPVTTTNFPDSSSEHDPTIAPSDSAASMEEEGIDEQAWLDETNIGTSSDAAQYGSTETTPKQKPLSLPTETIPDVNLNLDDEILHQPENTVTVEQASVTIPPRLIEHIPSPLLPIEEEPEVELISQPEFLTEVNMTTHPSESLRLPRISGKTTTSTPGILINPNLVQPSAQLPYPLYVPWTLYYSSTAPNAKRLTDLIPVPRHPKLRGAEEYSHGLFTLFTADTLEDLFGSWKALRRRVAFNKKRIIEPHGMKVERGREGLGLECFPDDTNFHFFRQGVKPMWEDVRCTKGGKVMLTASIPVLDSVFFHLVTLLAGGVIESSVAAPEGNIVVGLVLSRRKVNSRIEIWLGGLDPPARDWTKQVEGFIAREFRDCKLYSYRSFHDSTSKGTSK